MNDIRDDFRKVVLSVWRDFENYQLKKEKSLKYKLRVFWTENKSPKMIGISLLHNYAAVNLHFQKCFGFTEFGKSIQKEPMNSGSLQIDGSFLINACLKNYFIKLWDAFEINSVTFFVLLLYLFQYINLSVIYFIFKQYQYIF